MQAAKPNAVNAIVLIRFETIISPICQAAQMPMISKHKPIALWLFTIALRRRYNSTFPQ